MTYGAQTRVPISKTKADIEELLAKYGATGFGYATEGDRSLVASSMSGRRVQIMLVMPPIDDYARTARNAKRTAAAQRTAWEQVCRQRWRALLLIIRAKLEAVGSGITTLEGEFLANIVLSDGGTCRSTACVAGRGGVCNGESAANAGTGNWPSCQLEIGLISIDRHG